MNEEDINYAINLIKRCKERKSGYRERDYEAFDIAIRALERLLPVSPLFGGYRYLKHYYCVCPTCIERVTLNAYRCPNCGQLLKRGC